MSEVQLLAAELFTASFGAFCGLLGFIVGAAIGEAKELAAERKANEQGKTNFCGWRCFRS